MKAGRRQTTQGTPAGEPAAQACRGGPDARQADSQGSVGPPGKRISPSQRRQAVAHVRQMLGEEVSERRACKVLGQSRRTQRYVAQRDDDEPALVRRMLELVARHPRFGYRRIWALLKLEGWPVNKKRIWRLWRQEGLKVPQKKPKKRSMGGLPPFLVPPSMRGCSQSPSATCVPRLERSRAHSEAAAEDAARTSRQISPGVW